MIEIVCNQGSYSQDLSNIDILNKLKEIHEKIKRLNKTYSDPKFGRILNNRTQLFLDKNTQKFINMTSSFSKKFNTKENEENSQIQIAILGKFLPKHKKTTPLVPVKNLELEIEEFFESNNVQLTNNINEIERKKFLFKSNTGKI